MEVNEKPILRERNNINRWSEVKMDAAQQLILFLNYFLSTYCKILQCKNWELDSSFKVQVPKQ